MYGGMEKKLRMRLMESNSSLIDPDLYKKWILYRRVNIDPDTENAE